LVKYLALNINPNNMIDVTTAMPVSFTDAAISELKRLTIKEEIQGNHKPLRVGVKGGGCSGMTYVLEFDEPQSGDQEFYLDGVKIILNQTHELYLSGMQIDFGSGLNDRGFVFQNPNASKTCGCGTSFAV
jgi:iron-sulfur cluster assembly protein